MSPVRWIAAVIVISFLTMLCSCRGKLSTPVGPGPGNQATAAPWGMSGGDAANTGRTTYPGPRNTSLNWRIDFPEGPVEYVDRMVCSTDTAIYVAAGTVLLAIDNAGSQLWQYSAGEPIRGPVQTLADGSVRFVTESNRILTVNQLGSPTGSMQIPENHGCFGIDEQGGIYTISPPFVGLSPDDIALRKLDRQGNEAIVVRSSDLSSCDFMTAVHLVNGKVVIDCQFGNDWETATVETLVLNSVLEVELNSADVIEPTSPNNYRFIPGGYLAKSSQDNSGLHLDVYSLAGTLAATATVERDEGWLKAIDVSDDGTLFFSVRHEEEDLLYRSPAGGPGSTLITGDDIEIIGLDNNGELLYRTDDLTANRRLYRLGAAGDPVLVTDSFAYSDYEAEYLVHGDNVVVFGACMFAGRDYSVSDEWVTGNIGTRCIEWEIYGRQCHYAINTFSADGSLAWEFPLAYSYGFDSETPLELPVSDSAGGSYMALFNMLYAIDNLGRVKWQHQAEHGIDTAPLLDSQGNVLIYDSGMFVTSLDPAGQVNWKVSLGPPPSRLYRSRLIESDGSYYVSTADEVYRISRDGQANLLFSGTEVSPYLVLAQTGSLLIIVGQLQSFSRELISLSPDGTEEWRHSFAGTVFSTNIVATGDRIYAIEFLLPISENRLWCFGLDGTVIWNQVINDDGQLCDLTGVSTDGMVYIRLPYESVNDTTPQDDPILMAIGADGAVAWQLHNSGYDLAPESIGKPQTPPVIDGQDNQCFIQWINEARYLVRIGPDGAVLGYSPLAVWPDDGDDWDPRFIVPGVDGRMFLTRNGDDVSSLYCLGN